MRTNGFFEAVVDRVDHHHVTLHDGFLKDYMTTSADMQGELAGAPQSRRLNGMALGDDGSESSVSCIMLVK